MARSISRRKVRFIASASVIFDADEACAMPCISQDTMYRLAKDPDGPLPIWFHTLITLSFTLSRFPHPVFTTSSAPKSRPLAISSNTLTRMMPLRIQIGFARARVNSR